MSADAAVVAAAASGSAATDERMDTDERARPGDEAGEGDADGDSDADADGDADGEGEQQRLVMEEYAIWKKNTPFLYDCVVSHALEWPSLTVQWLPDRGLPEGKEYSVQRLLLGTHTSTTTDAEGDAAGGAAAAAAAAAAPVAPAPQNYLLIAEVRLPHGGASSAAKPASSKFGGGGGGKSGSRGAASGHVSSSHEVMSLDDDADVADEAGGAYGAQQGRVDIVQRIVHAGEVNRARYAPHNPDLIATKSPSHLVFVFDRSRHPSQPVAGAAGAAQQCRPDLVLGGHSEEGYGLAWNPHHSHQGTLLSGSNDHVVCMWDVEAASREAGRARRAAASTTGAGAVAASSLSSSMPAPIPPVSSFRAHTSVVEDVAWSHFQPSLFASCGDDRRLLLWDTRASPASASGGVRPVQSLNDPTRASAGSGRAQGHHTANINCVSFNYFTEFIVASGGSDGVVNLWDVRRVHAPIHSLLAHAPDAAPTSGTLQFFNLQFAPFSQDIVTASDADRRAYIWDLSRIGAAPEAAAGADGSASSGDEEADGAPPELLFVHGGHTDKIADMSWNPNAGEEWMAASVADDNILQIWQVAESVYEDGDGDMDRAAGSAPNQPLLLD